MTDRRTGLTQMQLASATPLSNANDLPQTREAAEEGVEVPGDSSCFPCGSRWKQKHVAASLQKALPLKIKLEEKLLLPPVLCREDFRYHPPRGELQPKLPDGHTLSTPPHTLTIDSCCSIHNHLNLNFRSACTFLDFTTRSK